MAFGTFWTTLATIAGSIVAYYIWAFGYWKRRRVPYLEPTIPFGTSENPFTRRQYIGYRLKDRYDWFKSRGFKHGGLFLFTIPNYLPVDPEYIKNILARDFRNFTDRGMYSNMKDDPLSGNLFNLEGQKWRNLRAKLTPTFTTGKIKLMLPNLLQCSDQLKLAMDGYADAPGTPVDIKDILGCFTTDVIGSCAFGIQCNSFTDPDSVFRKHCKKIFTSTTRMHSLAALIAISSGKLGRLLGITTTPPDVTEFFLRIVREAVKQRTDAAWQGNNNRKDFLQILVDLKNSSQQAGGLSIESMAAQTFAFFLAGFETSSTTMSFALYELAMNPDIQKRAREEVMRVYEQHEGELTYEAISELKYTGQVVDETLRKYPPAALIPRVCTEEYRMLGTGVTLDKGTRVLIPVYALHHDPEFYPEPDKFDPERFSEENKGSRHPFTYLPFGEGPRVCIGLRFGLMQTKVGLAILLKNYEFSVNSRTRVPLVLDSSNLVLSAKDGIWLDVKKLRNRE